MFLTLNSSRSLAFLHRDYAHRPQANAVWRWYRALLRVVPAGKRVLRINMDETSVAAFHGHEAGNITQWRKRGLDAGSL